MARLGATMIASTPRSWPALVPEPVKPKSACSTSSHLVDRVLCSKPLNLQVSEHQFRDPWRHEAADPQTLLLSPSTLWKPICRELSLRQRTLLCGSTRFVRDLKV